MTKVNKNICLLVSAVPSDWMLEDFFFFSPITLVFSISDFSSSSLFFRISFLFNIYFLLALFYYILFFSGINRNSLLLLSSSSSFPYMILSLVCVLWVCESYPNSISVLKVTDIDTYKRTSFFNTFFCLYNLLWCTSSSPSSVLQQIDLVFPHQQQFVILLGEEWKIFLDCSKKIRRDDKWGCERFRRRPCSSGSSSPWTILLLLPHWSVNREKRENL